MAQQDLAGLLTGITQAPIDPMAGASIAQRQLAMGAQAAQGLRQGMGGLFGADTRTTKEKADQMLASLDVNDVNDQEKILQIVSNVNPQAAPLLKAQFAQQGRGRDKQAAFTTYVKSKYGDALGQLAADNVITADNFNDFLNTSKIKGASKGESFKVKDADGNIFGAVTTVDLDTQEVGVSYTNLSPDSDVNQPVGAVTPIGGAYSLTANESADLAGLKAGKVEGKKAFAKRKAEAGNNYTAAGFALQDATKMLEALKQIKTGGSLSVIGKQITDVLGTTPTSVSEFERLAKAKVLAGLRRFGSNPTEGERNFAESIEANIGKTEGANEAQIQAYIDEMTRVQARERYLLSSDVDEAGFNEYTLNQWGDTNKEPSTTSTIKTIDFTTLDK